MQIKKYLIPKKLNLLLMIALTTINFFAMFYLPTMLLPQNGLWALLLVPIVLLTNTYWSLIHEGIHSIFNPNKKINNIACRIMSVTFGTVFQVVQFGHLIHHAYNRTEIDRPEVYEANKQNYILRAISYYFKLTIGLYVAEFFGPMLAYLPKNIVNKIADKVYVGNPQFDKIVKNRLFSPESLSIIRRDATVMYVLFILTFICYGHYGWLWLLVMLVRAFMVSVADNLPHYATRVDQVRYAYNLSMPAVLSKLILNFNLHRVHHEQPNVPWSSLPEAQAATNSSLDVNYFKQAIKQFNGLINIEDLK